MNELVIALLAMSLTVGAQGKEEDRLRECATVLKEIINIPDDIPKDLLRQPDGGARSG